MRTQIFTFLFIFTLSNFSFSQSLYEVRSLNSDSLKKYFEKEMEANYDLENFKLEVNKFAKDLIEIFQEEMKLINYACMSQRESKLYFEYLNALQDKIIGLDSMSKKAYRMIELEKQENIKRLFSKHIDQYEKRNNCQVLNSKVILYQDEKIIDATKDLKNQISNSKDFLKWTENNNSNKRLMGMLYFKKLLIINFFQNYKVNWVKRKWNKEYIEVLSN